MVGKVGLKGLTMDGWISTRKKINHPDVNTRLLHFGKFFCHEDKQGVCHTMALAFALKSILRQKKNYANSNISPCKNIPIFKQFL
jgi:hypothetical protein